MPLKRKAQETGFGERRATTGLDRPRAQHQNHANPQPELTAAAPPLQHLPPGYEGCLVPQNL